MLYQSDFTGKIRTYGCLVFSLLDIAEEMCSKKFDKEMINHMIKHLIKRGYINNDMYVNDHAAIINEGLSYLIEPNIRAKYVGAQYLDKPEKSWGAKEGEYIILQAKTTLIKGHFLRPKYNPFQPASRVLKIRSVRYYTIK